MTRDAVRDADASQPARAHVLVVDDDPGIRGFLEMTLRAAAEAHHADGYPEKPFNVDDLLRIVARLVPSEGER